MQDPVNPQIESSQGATVEPSKGEPNPTSQGEPQGEPDPKTQEGTPQWYKSQLDKNQNALNEKLTEKENIWAEEKQQLESQLQKILQDVGDLKKPQGEVLEPPKRSGTDDPEDEIRYLLETIEYNNKVYDNRFKKFEERFSKTEEELARERKLQEDAKNLEMVKSVTKGLWMEKNKMTIEEAEECWNWQNEQKGDDRIEAIGKLYLNSKGDGRSDIADELKKREDMKLGGAAPGAGAGGAASETDDPKNYTKPADHSNMYETK
jgi:hypothetical protein